jgi:ribonuclease R
MTSKKDSWQQRDPHFTQEQGRYGEPIPSRQLILDELIAAGEPLDLKALARRLGLRKKPMLDALDKRLGAMARDRQIQRHRGERFIALENFGEVTGKVSAHRDGYGWLAPDDGSSDLHIEQRQMRDVMHGDRVRARITADDGRGRRSGAILEILEHGTQELVGRFEDAGEVCFVIPEDPRFRLRLVVPAHRRGAAKQGDLVVARILERAGRGGGNPVAEVSRVLDTRSAADLAAELAIITHDLPNKFPEAVLREAAKWGNEVRAKDIEGREDLRDTPLVTIDGEDARDFDDAVFCEPVKGGWRLVVAIADVSHYVPVGSPLDQEALSRATSVYFPDRVIPMLPEALSNELCSLRPHVDRLSMVCDMKVDPTGEVTRARFYPAVIRSAARLTYTKVAAMLIGKDPQLRTEYAPLVPHLESLHAVYGALLQARVRRGALDFDAPELKIKLTEQGSVAAVEAHMRNDAHRLIEECMIAANIEAARLIKRKRVKCLFRVHGLPEERKTTELQRMLRVLGIGVRFPETIGTRELQQVTQLIAGRPDASFIQTLLIRSLPQAVYQPTNIGHFGLGLTEYTHFTSPIRRYPDLLVHRAIRHALAQDDRGYPYSAADMQRLGGDCSTKERRADIAAREVSAYLKCDYMRSHVGDEFEAVITSVVDFGVFVQLANMGIDGLVHVSDLRGDYYQMDQAHCAWVGSRTRLTYQLGQRVTVRLKRVDMAERQLDFEMVSEPVKEGLRGPGLPPITAAPQTKAGHSNRGASPKKKTHRKGRAKDKSKKRS